MNQEHLSALLDGELDEHEMRRTIGQIAADPQLARTWHRYHLIRAGLRREEAEANEALCERIAACLEREPAVLAPANLPARAPARPGSGRPWLALAAGLAMVSAAGWWLVQRQSGSPAAESTLAQTAAPVPAPHAEAWRERPELAEQLNTLLVRHGEFTPTLGMNGMATYVKIVSYDARP